MTAKLSRPTARWRRSGGCAVKATNPYLGRSRLAPERATPRRRSEKSAEAVVEAVEARRGTATAYRTSVGHDGAKGRTSRRV